MKKSTLAAVLALAAFALQVSAKTYYVKADGGSDANTGLKETAAFATIQYAIDKAAAGSTILVYPGTYAPIASNNKKLTIKTVEGADETIIDGEGIDETLGAELGAWRTQTYKERGWAVDLKNKSTGQKVTLKSYDVWSYNNYCRVFEVSVPKGWYFAESESSQPGMLCGTLWSERPPEWYFSSDYGEWEYADGYSLPGKSLGKCHHYIGGNSTTLIGFTIARCGLAVRSGALSNCVLRNNGGGAGYSKLTDCLITGNGECSIYECVLTGCEITDNNDTCIADCKTVSRCTITRNEGDSWSLIYGGNVFNTLVADNWGSRMVVYGTRGSSIYNSTIANNRITEPADNTESGECRPGAVDNWGNDNCGDVFNCIIWGNRDSHGKPANVESWKDAGTGEAEEYYDGKEDGYFSGSFIVRNSLVEDVKVLQPGNIKGDPCFIDPANGDYHLAPWSPCIDMGANDYQSKTGKFDLDSAARKVGKKVDMGAYELQPQTAVPADYDGDGLTDAAFYFGALKQWWIFKSSNGKIRTVTLPDANGTPCPADYDGDGKAEPAYFLAAAKTPEFVRIDADGKPDRKTFGEKGATPVAAHLDGAGNAATFGTYTANAKKPAFSFLGNPRKVELGAKASRPVVADFDADGKDDLGVYTATASKPAFSILQSGMGYAPSALFNGGPVALGPKGAIPCCADYDGLGGADFGVYMSNTKEPYFQRLFSSSKFRETRTLSMGSKGDVPVVGVYEKGQPAAPAVWTGSVWTYVDSNWEDRDLVGE